MEQIRSFVAVRLNDEIKRELGVAQALLKGKGIVDQVRWVKPESIHLTLKFLGNVRAARLKEIVVALQQASVGIGPFSLSFGGFGCFPSAGRPNVVWIGVDGDTKTLGHLQSRIEEGLSVLGYRPEKRGFAPHLTLARVRKHVSPRERRLLGGLIQSESVDLIGQMEVHEISLMKSELTPAGAIYAKLAGVELEG